MQKRLIKEQIDELGQGSNEQSRSKLTANGVESMELHPEEELLLLFKQLSPESRKATTRFVRRKAFTEKTTMNQSSYVLGSRSRHRAPDSKVLKKWKDEEGTPYRVVESVDGLTPNQRLDAVAEILAGVLLRIMKEQK